MFCINVALGSTSWRLLFRDDKKANAAFKELTTPLDGAAIIAINDEFGQTLFANRDAMHGVMFEDLDQTKLAHIEMALHQARTQNQAQKMAQADPMLRAGAHPNAGPAIINPMGNGFRPPS